MTVLAVHILARVFRSSTICAAVVVALASTGCTWLQPNTSSKQSDIPTQSDASEIPEDAVSQRANERWQTLIDGDFSSAYSYLMPSYRAIVTEQAYLNTFKDNPVIWTTANISKIICESERCTVSLHLATSMRTSKNSTTIREVVGVSNETWIKEDGQWWLDRKH
jgi:hypothetical protein